MTIFAELAAHGRAGRGDLPVFHRVRHAEFRLDLDLDGNPLGLVPLRTRDRRGHPAPSVKRTSNIQPLLGIDDVQYVLGWGAGRRADACHTAYRDMAHRWRDAEGAQDPAAAALAAFLDGDHARTLSPPPDITAKQQVLITVAGVPVTQSPTAAAFWAAEITRIKGAGITGLCMVCGRPGPLARSMPDAIPAYLIPGALHTVPLIQIEEPGRTPICLPCADDATLGMTRALSAPDTSMCAQGQDSRIGWWITGEDTDDPMALLIHPDRDSVDRLLARESGSVSPGRFHAVTVSAAGPSRLMIRDWIDADLAVIRANIGTWLQQIRTDQGSDYHYHSLPSMIAVCGRWLPDKNRHANPGEPHSRPVDAQRHLLRTILHATPVPHTLWIHLLGRIRRDGHVSAARIALMQANQARRPDRTAETPLPDPAGGGDLSGYST
ncbi:type I-C CRISPR-associated protein Cas8c/Csd1 [Nocardia terpenica]|nr:type I-C CRISPR-associated protein Cas8c/Csd1 [Nocardia terpenica]